MRRLSLTLACLSLAGLPACSLSRSVLGASPGSDASFDGGGVDAPIEPVDAPGIDAFVPDDVGNDTGPTGCIPTGATETACDRIDDDCNGTIDDGVCGLCVAITVAGISYLSCPPTTGMDAWSGACGRAAYGYDLAVFTSQSQQAAVANAFHLRSYDDQWIGLNNFAVDRHYVWRDRTTAFTPTTIGADDPMKRFVILHGDGTYKQATAGDSHRVLCQASAAPGPCHGGDESDHPCNGVDDDCNGRIDDGLSCGEMCTPVTFWDHEYYVCTQSAKQDDATHACDTALSGATLASVNDGIERDFLAGYVAFDAWVGLHQDMHASAVDAGWHWADGSTGFGVPAMHGVLPWDPGEPNDGGQPMENDVEDCGAMLAPGRMSHFDDRSCDGSLPFVCERPWTY